MQGTESEDEVEGGQGCSSKALHLGRGVDLTLRAKENWEIKRGNGDETCDTRPAPPAGWEGRPA